MVVSRPNVLVSEVGPRDGLQSIKTVMPTAARLRWISALAAAGLKEIEVGSFVPPKLLPQMADIREVVAHALSIPGLHVAVLAPNLRGSQSAFEAGVHKVTLPVSVTNEHSMANIRKTTEEMIDEVRNIVALRDERFPGVQIEAGVSVAFGCTIAGVVTDDETMRMCAAMAECGVDEIGLSDTSGYANPVQVRRLFRRLQSEFGAKAGGAHFHNTRGQGLANVVAALDAGVTTIDASQAGLGGCPYAPGATGNIVTEDLAFLLEAMGYDTGIDIDKLIAARALLAQALPGEALYGHVQDAGLPKGFTYADGRAPSAPQPEGCLLGVAQ
ncbi:pyruvate carboxyltransferase [Caballeronia catudaia]|uniref:Pyruvate carboxyltransferase n=1 Tax=Caballeronia catudaia TaxID=1777136 RepID=A0A158CKD5_9BURK|nr:hydroxymethylglutaryl-CoA lyase [Caballeronia catudaia]SAK82833.1 pyruvate carboxyltransferase [Caballeronia catudaia]